MHQSILQTKLALSRMQQNLQYIFMLVHLFGHKDEGGLDETALESIRFVIENTKNDLLMADQLLDDTLAEAASETEEKVRYLKVVRN